MNEKEIETTRTEALRLLNLGQKADALDRVWQALDRRDGDPRLWELRGTILTRVGMHLDAVRSYDRALELDPQKELLPYVWNNKGISLFALERYEEAEVAFSQACKRDWPYLPQAHNNLGLALMKLDCPADALKAFEEATQSKPDFHEAFNNRSQALECLGKLPEALASYNKSLELDDLFADAHANRGHVFEKLKQPEKALCDYEAAAAQSPGNTRYELDCARMLLKLNRPEAGRRLEDLLARDPVFERAAHLLGTRATTWWEWWFSKHHRGRMVLGLLLLLLLAASLILPLLRLRYRVPVYMGAPWHQYVLTAVGSLLLLLSPVLRRIRIERAGFEVDLGSLPSEVSSPVSVPLRDRDS